MPDHTTHQIRTVLVGAPASGGGRARLDDREEARAVLEKL